MHLKLLLLMGAVLPALAQFESLATPDDGSILFFTTRLRQAGTDQPTHGKLFIADEQGVRPLLIINREWTQFPLAGGISNYYDVVGTDIAGNGSRLVTVTWRECTHSTEMCVFSDQTLSTVYDWRGQENASLPGGMRLSQNGRWGILTQVSNEPVALHDVIDLDTGAKYLLTWSNFGAKYDWRKSAIANNGTAVSPSTELLIFRPPDQLRTVKANPESAAIDAEGSIVVWADATTPARSLHVLHLSATADAVSLAVPDRDDYAPSISNDGTRILFLSRLIDSNRPQVFVVKPDGTLRRQITNETEGIASAILSGNGAVAWALTRTGRVLRIDVGSSAVTQVIGQVPALLTRFGDGALGEVLTVQASVLGDESLTVDVGGTASPPLSVGDGTVTFQMPWDLPLTFSGKVGLRTTAPNVWEGQTMSLHPYSYSSNARFVSGAVHQDWQSLVTPDRPAEPGEIVHLYAVGLGAVTTTPATGVPAPSSPLSFLATLMRCSAPDPARTVEVLYAGLAPGTIGYYQVSLRLPEVLVSSVTVVTCALEVSGWGKLYPPYIPTRINAAP